MKFVKQKMLFSISIVATITSERFVPKGWEKLQLIKADCRKSYCYFFLYNILMLQEFRVKCLHHQLNLLIVRSSFLWGYNRNQWACMSGRKVSQLMVVRGIPVAGARGRVF